MILPFIELGKDRNEGLNKGICNDKKMSKWRFLSY